MQVFQRYMWLPYARFQWWENWAVGQGMELKGAPNSTGHHTEQGNELKGAQTWAGAPNWIPDHLDAVCMFANHWTEYLSRYLN